MSLKRAPRGKSLNASIFRDIVLNPKVLTHIYQCIGVAGEPLQHGLQPDVDRLTSQAALIQVPPSPPGLGHTFGVDDVVDYGCDVDGDGSDGESVLPHQVFVEKILDFYLS